MSSALSPSGRLRPTRADSLDRLVATAECGRCEEGGGYRVAGLGAFTRLPPCAADGPVPRSVDDLRPYRENQRSPALDELCVAHDERLPTAGIYGRLKCAAHGAAHAHVELHHG